MTTELWAILMVISAAIVGSLAPILIKKASKDLKFNLEIFKNKYLFGGVFLYGIGTILFIPALKGGELSVLYPFVSVAYIWVSLFSVKFLGEKMNMYKWAGIALIIIGVSFIGFGSK